MLIQIIDVDYLIVNGKPLIRIFGKNKENKSVCVFYNGFMPYFYVKKKEGIEIKDVKRMCNALTVREIEGKSAIGFRKNKEKFYKIFLTNPANTPEYREKMKNAGFEVFEADIPFKNRFMIDKNIFGMGWIRVYGKSTYSESVTSDIKIEANKIESIEVDQNVELKCMSIDIECLSGDGKMPDPQKDKIIMMAIAFSELYKGKKSIVLSLKKSKNALFFNTEKEMLEKLVEIIRDYDPDIITGYNINNFDMPYIIKRMDVNKIKKNVGRCNEKGVSVIKIGNRYKINIIGRIVVDTYELIKKDFMLKRYDLDFVSNTLLKERKVDVRHSEIERLWKSKNQDDIEKLVEYNVKDAELALKLLINLELLEKYIALSKVSGSLLQDVLNAGESSRIENLLFREFKKNGFILPCKPENEVVIEREKRKKIELKGGYVIEPKKGLFDNIVVLDFKSMYPSIIITYNICPTTLVKEECGVEYIESPSGAKFVKTNVHVGVIPRILKKLMKERYKIKGMMKSCEDKKLLRIMDAKQWALKIMANAFYGHFGYVRARIYDLNIANSITAFGRKIIKNTKESIEKKYGYEVVYGDTDSVMVKIDGNSLDEIEKNAKKIAKEISKELPGILELEYEKVFKRFLPLTKKRYAAWSFIKGSNGWKNNIETKGIETIRRDWCDLVSDTLEKILEIILKEKNIKGVIKYLKSVMKNMNEGKIDINKLIITKTITKNLNTYKGIQPHIELAKKIMKRSPADAPGVGDRIGFVIVRGNTMLSERAEDPRYVVENGIEIDTNYYVESQLWPPIERILESIGIDKSEVFSNSKQENIFKFKGDKYKKMERIKFENCVCISCGKKYALPPLSGFCICGKKIYFNSGSFFSEFAILVA